MFKDTSGHIYNYIQGHKPKLYYIDFLLGKMPERSRMKGEGHVFYCWCFLMFHRPRAENQMPHAYKLQQL